MIDSMIYIVDTANVEAIRHCVEYFPVTGVTTNPTIISKEHADFPTLLKRIRKVIGEDRMFHVQATGDTAEEMVNEATLLSEYVGGNFYVKIPVSPEGLKATMELKRRGIKVTETAIFTQQQALLAAAAGADFVAPYVNRLDNINCDGVQVVADIVRLFKEHDLSCRVLAASFKTVEQVHKVAMAGAQAVTINPQLFDTLVSHPMTDRAIASFNADWESVYGDSKIVNLFAAKRARKVASVR